MRLAAARTGMVCGITFLLCGIAVRGQNNAPVKLEVDLRDAAKRVYHSKMEFPVKPGPLTLVYPKSCVFAATGRRLCGGAMMWICLPFTARFPQA